LATSAFKERFWDICDGNLKKVDHDIESKFLKAGQVVLKGPDYAIDHEFELVSGHVE
jgi:hypothetical protein